jgi:hypothetical protein
MPTNIDIASTAENKITAARIETDCPTELANQGALIAKCLREADDCDACAEECRIAAGKLIAEAYEACDSDGFDAFRKRFFPQVGRSRAYELMAVATGKKSANEIQKSNRERVARYRAKKAAESVTVTDSPRFDTGDKSVTINNSESNASSDVVYLRDWRTGEVSTVCTDNHAHLGVDQPTSAEGGTDKVETLKAETEAQSQVATAAPAIEVVPEKPETLLAPLAAQPLGGAEGTDRPCRGNVRQDRSVSQAECNGSHPGRGEGQRGVWHLQDAALHGQPAGADVAEAQDQEVDIQESGDDRDR